MPKTDVTKSYKITILPGCSIVLHKTVPLHVLVISSAYNISATYEYFSHVERKIYICGLVKHFLAGNRAKLGRYVLTPPWQLKNWRPPPVGLDFTT